MPVLIDTPVWSLAFRRSSRQALSSEQRCARAELADLVQQARAKLIGPIRQELLSGIRIVQQYEQLRNDLRAFEDAPLLVEDYEEAARMNNLCRSSGIAGSAIDFLICAVSARRKWPIFTFDQDFLGYARVFPIRLHTPSKSEPESL